jgi:hypothetical protein
MLTACASKHETNAIQVPTVGASEQVHVTREALLHIDPGATSLEDLYQLMGHPTATKTLTNTVALRYPSELGKLPHIVVIDEATGKVLAISVYNHNNALFSLAQLKDQYGEPVVADTIYSRDHLFFPGRGVAVIVKHDNPADLWYVQSLPRDMTLEEYRVCKGYWQETLAFTP